mmetsp:Transcript_21880/g.31410  ORF Transcript_21880/g.31410 Transcript_21880/m.31410 type:complete len:161 (-) Transcript_21880:145-627(-)
MGATRKRWILLPKLGMLKILWMKPRKDDTEDFEDEDEIVTKNRKFPKKVIHIDSVTLMKTMYTVTTMIVSAFDDDLEEVHQNLPKNSNRHNNLHINVFHHPQGESESINEKAVVEVDQVTQVIPRAVGLDHTVTPAVIANTLQDNPNTMERKTRTGNHNR